MPLTWSEILNELRRADLLESAPAQGPNPTGLGVDSRVARLAAPALGSHSRIALASITASRRAYFLAP